MTATIPHPRWRVPFLGDVLGTNPRTPVQDTMRMGRELGPIFTRRFLDQEIVFVGGAALAADLADESRFAKHLALGVEALRDVGGDGLFTAYNEEPNWKAAHDVLLPAFTQSAMRAYHPTMVDVTAQLVEKWDRGGVVDVSADMTNLTLETIGRVGFGYSFESFSRTEVHPFVRAMIGSLRYAQRKNFVLPVKARPGHVYKPFGTGERACIGRQFAVHEATLALGTLLRRYELVGAPDYELRVAEMLTLKPDGFTVTPRRR